MLHIRTFVSNRRSMEIDESGPFVVTGTYMGMFRMGGAIRIFGVGSILLAELGLLFFGVRHFKRVVE